MVALAVVGLALGSCKGHGAHKNLSSIERGFTWAAFGVGMFWVCLITLPLFSALSIISVPFSGFCGLIPSTGDDPSNVIALFNDSVGLKDPSLSDIFSKCLLAPELSLLNLTNNQQILSAFDQLQQSKYKVPNQTASTDLAAELQGADFKKSLGGSRLSVKRLSKQQQMIIFVLFV
jgi:hypothetical protein